MTAPARNPSSSKDYRSDAIEVLRGLDPVRHRPGMYTHTSSPLHLVQEVVDNSVDEALAGHCTSIDVCLWKDGSVSVDDDGRGMPVDTHPEEGVSGVELILTKLHAGAKFREGQYNFSGGLHGVGVSVVNALSAWLQVEVQRDGALWRMEFENGFITKSLSKIKSCPKSSTGSMVHFYPKSSYFDSPVVPVKPLRDLLMAKAVLCPGLCVSLWQEATDETESWENTAGLSDWFMSKQIAQIWLLEQPLSGTAADDDNELTWVLNWIDASAEAPGRRRGEQWSWANLIPTPQGGSHVSGMLNGVLAAVREYCDLQGKWPKNLVLTVDDVLQGCSFAISSKLRDGNFSGQTKERLSARRHSFFVQGAVRDTLSLWLNKHTQDADALVELLRDNVHRRLRADMVSQRKSAVRGPSLPGKLADCTSTDIEKTELYLVEGDSAGGSARQARDRNFQAIMPLRGKILNTWEVGVERLMDSETIKDLCKVLGVAPHSDDLEGLRYGRICILADADSDGLHIAALLCGLLVRHFKPLVCAGKVYAALPPLFRLEAGDDVRYAHSEAECQTIVAEMKAKKSRGRPSQVRITRFKGLGEMNASHLRETVMRSDSRRLIQLQMDEGEEDSQILDMLFSRKKASERRSWLEASGSLERIAEEKIAGPA